MKKMLFSILMLLSCGQLQSKPTYTFKIDSDPTKVIFSNGTKSLTLKCPSKVSFFVQQNPSAIATLQPSEQTIYPMNYKLRLTSSQGGQRGNKMERPVHQDFTCRNWTKEDNQKPTQKSTEEGNQKPTQKSKGFHWKPTRFLA